MTGGGQVREDRAHCCIYGVLGLDEVPIDASCKSPNT
jgi:hypothetical protein